MQKEYKSFPVEFKEIQPVENYFTFKGYSSVFGNVDFGNDVILQSAFDKALSNNTSFPLLWQHDMHEPIGIGKVSKNSIGLYTEGSMPLDDDLVKGRVIPQMKIGAIREMSIGFFLKDYEFDKDGVRILKEIELFEISLVTKAMNPKAVVESFKSFGANTKLPFAPRSKEWDSTQAEKRIREFTNSTDSPSSDYKKYFMYFDNQAPELFGSYKLLFADVIDGKPMIMPRAIFAIAGVLEGARGGVDIPAEDRNRVITAVNQLYKKMAIEFEDDTIVSPISKSFESLKDVEASLKLAGYSNTEAKTLISKVKEFSIQRDVEDNTGQRDVARTKQIDDLRKNIELFNLTNKINLKNDNRS
jgi:HK97 family phage prohead protease